MKAFITLVVLGVALSLVGCRVEVEDHDHHHHGYDHHHHHLEAENVKEQGGGETLAAVDVGLNWQPLGECVLDYTSEDHKLVTVANPSAKFTRVSVTVTNADLQMFDVNILLDNGERYTVGEQHQFARGSNRWIIEMGSLPRTITGIEFSYRDVTVGLKPQVEFYAQ